MGEGKSKRGILYLSILKLTKLFKEKIRKNNNYIKLKLRAVDYIPQTEKLLPDIVKFVTTQTT